MNQLLNKLVNENMSWLMERDFSKTLNWFNSSETELKQFVSREKQERTLVVFIHTNFIHVNTSLLVLIT